MKHMRRYWIGPCVSMQHSQASYYEKMKTACIRSHKALLGNFFAKFAVRCTEFIGSVLVACEWLAPLALSLASLFLCMSTYLSVRHESLGRALSPFCLLLTHLASMIRFELRARRPRKQLNQNIEIFHTL
eukprot:Rmarinus@m.14448